ncbi:MAG TPA: acylphosphatase [Myxococcota bacterium]|nr:acylphosphatase [Myxococcota bacterium]
MEHRHIRVSGRVQGVFFRAETQRKARALGLTGFVRNEPDGSVRIEAEGEAEALDRLEAWVQEGGPEAARVDRADSEPGAPKGFEDFEVRR